MAMVGAGSDTAFAGAYRFIIDTPGSHLITVYSTDRRWLRGEVSVALHQEGSDRPLAVLKAPDQEMVKTQLGRGLTQIDDAAQVRVTLALDVTYEFRPSGNFQYSFRVAPQ